MKKGLIILITLCISSSVIAQEEFSRNEIRVNFFPSLFFLFPEISYERILNEHFSAGISAGIATSQYPMLRDFNVIPFGRFYFGEQPARGFFIEVNAAMFGPGNGLGTAHYGSDDPNDGPFSRFERTYFGAGVGAGFKVMRRNHTALEFLIGGGRANGKTRMGDSYPRFGISIGRRF